MDDTLSIVDTIAHETVDLLDPRNTEEESQFEEMWAIYISQQVTDDTKMEQQMFGSADLKTNYLVNEIRQYQINKCNSKPNGCYTGLIMYPPSISRENINSYMNTVIIP